jgi:2-haloacid dehalogenase
LPASPVSATKLAHNLQVLVKGMRTGLSPLAEWASPVDARLARPLRYRTLLFDLDSTLFDATTSEDAAFDETLRLAGVDDPPVYRDLYNEINGALWAAVERGELTPLVVRNLRFEQLVERAGLEADPQLLADTFVAGMGKYGGLYDGAREVLQALSGRVPLALVTNGLSEVQRTRVERLDLTPLFDAIVISSEVGVAKPSPGFFDIAFERLGWPAKDSALMVGDSLTSDMRGGYDYGMATCWYNPTGKTNDQDDIVTHEISDLEELIALVGGTRS